MKIRDYLTEQKVKTQKKTLTLYHGVRKKENVEKILKQGFKLEFIKPRWTNDYAVSALTSSKGIKKYFGRDDIPILKFKFSGNVYVPTQRFETIPDYITKFASGPREYTRNVVKAGIDAVDLGGRPKQYFIYNTEKISNIELVE